MLIFARYAYAMLRGMRQPRLLMDTRAMRAHVILTCCCAAVDKDSAAGTVRCCHAAALARRLLLP